MNGEPQIECAPNGLLRVHGLTRLSNSKGTVLATKEVTARCHCGGSKSKPFCDGTLWALQFEDESN